MGQGVCTPACNGQRGVIIEYVTKGVCEQGCVTRGDVPHELTAPLITPYGQKAGGMQN